MSGPVPTHDVSPEEVEGLMRAEPEEMAMDHKTEAQLLTAMASATSQAEQERLAAELSALREGRAVQARAHDEAMWAEATLEEAPVTPHRAPYSRSTMDTDWLGSYEAAKVDTGEAESKMRAEASTWYSHLHPGVKEHPDEVLIQAAGLSEVLASQYGAASARAEVAFLEQVRHHAATEGMPIPDPASIRPEPYEHGQYDGSTETSASDTPSLAEGDEPADDEAPSQGGNQSENLDASTWPSQDDATWNNGDEPPGQKTASRKTASISLTQVGVEGPGVGVGTDPSGNRVRFSITPKEEADLKAVLYSDLAINFAGVDIEESDLIKEGSRKTAAEMRPATSHEELGHSQGWGHIPGAEYDEGRLMVPRSWVNPSNVATCGSCGRSWDAEQYPTPASLCPFCNGDERAAAPYEIRNGKFVSTSRKTAGRKHAVDVNVIDLSVCGDCLMAAANGYDPHEWGRTASPEPWAEWVGYPGHPVAGDATDGSFSHSMCEGCGSRLGGDRYPAYWMEPKSAAHASRKTAGWTYLQSGEPVIDGPVKGYYDQRPIDADGNFLAGVATCGSCGRSWDAEGYPTPAGLCPFCNGDDRAAAPYEVIATASRKTASARAETLREIVDRHQHQEIDGMIVDVQTANLLLQVFDALSDKNKARFDDLPLDRLVDLGWRSLASRKTAGEYKGGSPKEGDTATCHKDGGKIQFFAGEWMHLKGTGSSHNDVYPASKSKEGSRRTASQRSKSDLKSGDAFREDGRVFQVVSDPTLDQGGIDGPVMVMSVADPGGNGYWDSWGKDEDPKVEYLGRADDVMGLPTWASRRTAAEGNVCATCGDKIAKDPSGENPSTWHHDNGESHDHEAKPASKESSLKRAAAKIKVGDQDKPALKALATLDSVEDDFEGISGRRVVEHLLTVGQMDDGTRRALKAALEGKAANLEGYEMQHSRWGSQRKTADRVNNIVELADYLQQIGVQDKRFFGGGLIVRREGKEVFVQRMFRSDFAVTINPRPDGSNDGGPYWYTPDTVVEGILMQFRDTRDPYDGQRLGSRKQAAVGDQCWGCGGKGWVRTPMGSDWDDPYGEQFMEVTCSTCGGSGVVNEPTDYPLADDPIFTDRWASRRKTASKVSPDDLNDKVEFGGPFRVGPDGDVTDEHGVFAPEVFFLPGQQGPNDLEVGSNDWEVWSTGRSGQHSYRGGIMHPSEFLGGGMAKDLLSEPGVYVLTEPIDPDDMGGDPIGWVVLKHKFA